MKRVPVSLLALILSLTAFAGSSNKNEAASVSPAVHSTDADSMRAQGEQRFRPNCGRCHATPQKFPHRALTTVLHQMRVRATITDQDMQLVLFYMTQ
jgi:hypothetical protein